MATRLSFPYATSHMILQGRLPLHTNAKTALITRAWKTWLPQTPMTDSDTGLTLHQFLQLSPRLRNISRTPDLRTDGHPSCHSFPHLWFSF